LIDGDNTFCANCGEYEDSYFPEGGGWGQVVPRKFTFMEGRIICLKCWKEQNDNM
jgi:hypothetical protein